MSKSPEEIYNHHRQNADTVGEKNEELKRAQDEALEAKSAYDKHVAEARQAGDITRHPELYDQASTEYQAAVKEKITEAANAKDFDRVRELILGLRTHLDMVERNDQEMEKKRFGAETPSEEIEGAPVVKETREKILAMVSEADWQRAKDDTLARLQSGDRVGYTLDQLAEMRAFDPARFDKEIDISDSTWRQLAEEVESRNGLPRDYLNSARNLKAVNPKLFAEQFSSRAADAQKQYNLKIIMQEVWKSEAYIIEFLWLASNVKDLDPERFQQEIGASEKFTSTIWPQIVELVERMRAEEPKYFALAASEAQNIKPASEPDITMDEETWSKTKEELGTELRNRNFRSFFLKANDASRLRVENK